MGKLLSGEGKSRYITSNPWHNLEDDEMQGMSDDDEDGYVIGDATQSFAPDPLTAAFMFMGGPLSCLPYHPSPAEAVLLWETHVENVEPICKILHVPSTSQMVNLASAQPEAASKADECLLFAIYHFAIFSMTEQDCIAKFRESRAALMQRYHAATRQALVNASFLKTTEMSVLQAFILFLIPCRYTYDPHTYWILTGVAIRIAQRMGLHRDGEKLGLAPFDVHMRRRLFYQLLSLDGVASQLSGTGLPAIPDSWDTQQPMNVNDNQIWPGMTEMPVEQKGATEMIFCLARSCLGRNFVSTGQLMRTPGPRQFKGFAEADRAINEAESEVEEKYIRYCDIINPLHFLTIGLARSGIVAMRLRVRLAKFRNQTATDEERREMFELSLKILEMDTAAYANQSLKVHEWFMRPFFLFGSWDSFIFVLTTLWKLSSLLSPMEVNTAWGKVEQIFQNHREFLESKRALQTALGRLTLKAWNTNPPSNAVPEPAFIESLRFLQKEHDVGKAEKRADQLLGPRAVGETESTVSSSLSGGANTIFDTVSGDGAGMDTGNEDFMIDPNDWILWDELVPGYRAQDNP